MVEVMAAVAMVEEDSEAAGLVGEVAAGCIDMRPRTALKHTRVRLCS